ncbi:MAG TPA: hypothetical protein VFY28_00515 [Candidatus Paceibacterota bacterium]|nr:hypothetical protein [Candidatus Paceibacterota bacterium]
MVLRFLILALGIAFLATGIGGIVAWSTLTAPDTAVYGVYILFGVMFLAGMLTVFTLGDTKSSYGADMMIVQGYGAIAAVLYSMLVLWSPALVDPAESIDSLVFCAIVVLLVLGAGLALPRLRPLKAVTVA